jgi:hypothetical protein
MNYLGDMDDNLSTKFTKPGFGIHLTVLPETKFNFGITFIHGELACDDAEENVSKNKYRNLNFYTDINEITLQAMFRFQKRGNNFNSRHKLVPYVFAGIGFFHFNPKTKLNSNEYELQKIGTEGQYLTGYSTPNGDYPEPYSLWQINIPFGAGVKVKITRELDLGLEIGFRKTFTDYLDDLSGYYPDKDLLLDKQGETALYLSDPSNDPARPDGRKSFSPRGNPDKDDWYVYTNFNVSWYFTTKMFRGKQRFSIIN